jgi:hypothetical protein
MAYIETNGIRIQKRRRKWLSIKSITLIALIVSTGSTIYFAWKSQDLQNSLYNLQVASTRADISILFNPLVNQNWTFTSDGAYLTVNGTLSNEGSRDAIITKMELSMIYNVSNDRYTLTTVYTNPCVEYGWNNNNILKNEIKSFHLTMFVKSNTWIVPRTGQIREIGNSRSDEIGICVRYNDGEGDLSNTQEFETGTRVSARNKKLSFPWEFLAT